MHNIHGEPCGIHDGVSMPDIALYRADIPSLFPLIDSWWRFYYVDQRPWSLALFSVSPALLSQVKVHLVYRFLSWHRFPGFALLGSSKLVTWLVGARNLITLYPPWTCYLSHTIWPDPEHAFTFRRRLADKVRWKAGRSIHQVSIKRADLEVVIYNSGVDPWCLLSQ